MLSEKMRSDCIYTFQKKLTNLWEIFFNILSFINRALSFNPRN